MRTKQKPCTENCEKCKRKFCYYSCYNLSCSCRIEFSTEITDMACENAHNCIGFISRNTYLERKKAHESKK